MDDMGEELLLYENLQYLGHWPYIVFFFFFFNSLQQSSKRGILLARIFLVVNDGNLIQANLSETKKGRMEHLFEPYNLKIHG